MACNCATTTKYDKTKDEKRFNQLWTENYHFEDIRYRNAANDKDRPIPIYTGRPEKVSHYQESSLNSL